MANTNTYTNTNNLKPLGSAQYFVSLNNENYFIAIRDRKNIWFDEGKPGIFSDALTELQALNEMGEAPSKIVLKQSYPVKFLESGVGEQGTHYTSCVIKIADDVYVEGSTTSTSPTGKNMALINTPITELNKKVKSARVQLTLPPKPVEVDLSKFEESSSDFKDLF